MRRYIVATILLLALAGTAHAATPSDPPASERRTALVIGNSDYELISPLRNIMTPPLPVTLVGDRT